MRDSSILVVGAGFAGAVAARVLAEAGHHVAVIDRRDHVAGNAFDEIDARGVRIHRYGPHLFHTSNERVVGWLSRFTDWTPYAHKVTALLPSGVHAPLPINRRTLEAVFGQPLDGPEAAQALLAAKAEDLGRAPANAEEYLRGRIGRDLTDLFFAPYTAKMWGLSLADMDAAVVKRIPLRFDDEDRYFPDDSFQALPTGGYTALVAAILDHPHITVTTGCAFAPEMTKQHAFSFLCSPIDEFYDFRFGPLPYRSIRFHHEGLARAEAAAPSATVNYTDRSPFTRSTTWHLLPGHDAAGGPEVTRTTEEPCDYRDNGFERYYPVKTADGRFDARYRDYRALADADDRLDFIGRCGTYQYLDMHQVVNQTLAVAGKWLEERRSEPAPGRPVPAAGAPRPAAIPAEATPAEATPANVAPAAPRYAVLFRTHLWDAFVERQFARLKERVGRGDLFVLLDETGGPVATGQEAVVSHTNAGILDLGLAAAGEGNLLWYNGDYPLYAFLREHPGYDYYVMTEYDVCVNADLDDLVDRAARAGAGLVSLTKGEPVAEWAHAASCQESYPPDAVRKSLICFAMFSRAAVERLFEKRLALSQARARGEIARWPFCEGFIPTELAVSGFRQMELSELGSTAQYDWWPPVLEDDLPTLAAETFVHPVLDRARFVDSALRIWQVPDLFDGRSALRQRLRKVPVSVYGPRLARVLRTRVERALRRRLDRAA
ncbi:FAD-dependent oxidoreductase [Methylobacterium sp. JK268]